jgi:hypothetical protein
MSKRIASDADPLLLTAANVIEERVYGMQQMVDRISVLVIERNGLIPEMVVAFQAFDRLNQEFMALGGLLKHYAAAKCNDRPLIAASAVQSIPLSQLKSLFLDSVPDPATHDDLLAIGAITAEGDKIF